jgi:protein ImuB
MSRIVSAWLPRWPIQRFLAAQAKSPTEKPVAPERPFVLALAAAGGPRIAALNEAAEAAGLMVGDSLADARVKAGMLQARTVDAAADDAALRRLALWATRYTPTASPWSDENGADGFFLDIEGAAHLFGGEEKLIADLSIRLEKSFGLTARFAIAATPGAAWALSHFHAASACVLPSGADAAEALSPLPIKALRLSPDIRTMLRRLGFKSVGALIDKPRAPFAARFPAALLRRLDQALGRAHEPLVPIIAPPVYHSLNYLLEPIITQQAIVALASRLMRTLVHVLTRDGVGARALRLSLYNVDGAVEAIDVGLTLPTRSVSHLTRLIDLKLDTLATTLESGFGYEAVGLAVTRAEPMPAQQTELTPTRPCPTGGGGSQGGYGDRQEPCAALIDTLRQRLGPHSVRQFQPIASHLPERAEALASLDGEAPAWRAPEQIRPLLLLPHAEPTEVTALVPDGPPWRFCWRGVTFEVENSQGPERIGSEWWRYPTPILSPRSRKSGNPSSNKEEKPDPRLREDEGQHALTRDYYVVEDADGRRFWLFREGLYGRETTKAHWFVHGLFA